MKIRKVTIAASALVIALISGEVRAETAADIGILPSQKVPANVDSGDRNPFGTRIAPGESDQGVFDAESEESRIRQVFANLQVNGHVEGSHRVLVGDLILKEGMFVPQVIENQTDVLRVTRISDKDVEITWVDEEEAEAPRRLLISINLDPVVNYVLPGRGGSSQAANQFVKMSKSDPEEGAGRPAVAAGGDPLVDDEDEVDGLRPKEQPEKPKSVSPFGLFRR